MSCFPLSNRATGSECWDELAQLDISDSLRQISSSSQYITLLHSCLQTTFISTIASNPNSQLPISNIFLNHTSQPKQCSLTTLLPLFAPPHRHDHRPQPSPLTPPLACHLYHLLPREHEKLVGFKMRRPSVDGYGTFPSQADPRSIEGADTIIKISTVTWLPALEKLLGPGLLLGVASE